MLKLMKQKEQLMTTYGKMLQYVEQMLKTNENILTQVGQLIETNGKRLKQDGELRETNTKSDEIYIYIGTPDQQMCIHICLDRLVILDSHFREK